MRKPRQDEEQVYAQARAGDSEPNRGLRGQKECGGVGAHDE